MDKEITKKTFSISENISLGWHLMWKNVGSLILFEIFSFLILVLVGIPGNAAFLSYFNLAPSGNSQMFIRFFAGIIHWLVMGIFSIGFYNVYLKIIDSQQIKIGDLFTKSHLLLRYIIASFCASLATIIGLICLIIPGLIIALRFSLFGFDLVDKQVGGIQSLEDSWDLIGGCTWKIFFFFITVMLINLLGLLCLGIGLLFTIPATGIASGLVYRKLAAQTQQGAIASF